jgi:hypothetical protein
MTGPDARTDFGFDLRPDPVPSARGESGDVDTLHAVDRQQGAGLVDCCLNTRLDGIGRVDHVCDEAVIEFETGQPLKDCGGDESVNTATLASTGMVSP